VARIGRSRWWVTGHEAIALACIAAYFGLVIFVSPLLLGLLPMLIVGWTLIAQHRGTEVRSSATLNADPAEDVLIASPEREGASSFWRDTGHRFRRPRRLRIAKRIVRSVRASTNGP
jgi:hypothetical protein